MSENKTVYILGAGFNQCINGELGLKPPLSTNFFTTILKNERYTNEDYYKKNRCVYDYIYRYWQKSKEKLKCEEFNIEDCFTLIQLQILEAKNNNDYKTLYQLLNINSQLKFMFTESLSEFQPFISSSDLMINFGRLIFTKEANVITFNYDCNLENAIKTIDHTDAFNISTCYGLNFHNLPKTISSNWNILKLHGSLNWFKYIYANSTTEIILTDNISTYQYENQKLLIEPLIIPPVLYKDYEQKFICTLWQKAKSILSHCKTLIVVGYSFPATDFGIKKLLLESFVSNKLDKLIIVNPNTSIVNTVKQLTHFDKPVIVCDSLNEFLKNLGSIY